MRLNLDHTTVMAVHRAVQRQINYGSGPLTAVQKIIRALGGVPDDGEETLV
ncbi:hypothetical protein [Mycolicibacterium conceptionense]|uniref:hypothetical protein n=1 Tax=Mycolicibacterium conceptionense TaxID=451644 RepID=UPI000B15E3F8|nr:hypothetical protein [Mycolicibacterium conceptionense]